MDALELFATMDADGDGQVPMPGPPMLVFASH